MQWRRIFPGSGRNDSRQDRTYGKGAVPRQGAGGVDRPEDAGDERRLARLVKALPDARPPGDMTERVMGVIEDVPALTAPSESGSQVRPVRVWGWAAAAGSLFVAVPLILIALFEVDLGDLVFAALLYAVGSLYELLLDVLKGIDLLGGFLAAGSLVTQVVTVMARSGVVVVTGIAMSRPDLLLLGLGGTLLLASGFVKLLRLSPRRGL